MSFLVALALGLYLGFKLKGAIVFLKETRNIKYIESVVNKVLNEGDLKVYNSSKEVQTEKENAELEKEYRAMRLRRYKGAL